MTSIYRFKFSLEVSEILSNFAKIHQYDERVDYKEAWKIWCEDNNEIIENEKELHNKKGYTGDIITKMYNSARYYYRNKTTLKNEPIKRKKYNHIGKNILISIDDFINQNQNQNMKPSIGFDIYYELNRNNNIKRENLMEEEKYKSILKKIYKNRCYNINRRKK